MQQQINVMFDISVLLDPIALKRASQFIHNNREQFHFFVSGSFVRNFKSNEFRPEDFLEKIANLFDLKKHSDVAQLNSFIKEADSDLSFFTPYDVLDVNIKEKYANFSQDSKKIVGDNFFSDVIFDEWVFLQEKSWIVATKQKIFTFFQNAKAIALEFPSNLKSWAVKNAEKLEYVGELVAFGLSIISGAGLLPLIGESLPLAFGMIKFLGKKEKNENKSTLENNNFQEIGQNVNIAVNKDECIIKINLNQKIGPSSTGKSTLIATTKGNVNLPSRSEIQIGINCYIRNSK